MLITIQNPESEHLIVVDLDTGKVLRHCAWANDTTGQYQRYDLWGNLLPVEARNISIVDLRAEDAFTAKKELPELCRVALPVEQELPISF